MTKRTPTVIVCAILCALLLAGAALAMPSDNYRLDWFTPLTGGGGGAASSPHYALNFTVGQSVIGTNASANHRGCLGYWCGMVVEYGVYLPLTLRNY